MSEQHPVQTTPAAAHAAPVAGKQSWLDKAGGFIPKIGALVLALSSIKSQLSEEAKIEITKMEKKWNFWKWFFHPVWLFLTSVCLVVMEVLGSPAFSLRNESFNVYWWKVPVGYAPSTVYLIMLTVAFWIIFGGLYAFTEIPDAILNKNMIDIRGTTSKIHAWVFGIMLFHAVMLVCRLYHHATPGLLIEIPFSMSVAWFINGMRAYLAETKGKKVEVAHVA